MENYRKENTLNFNDVKYSIVEDHQTQGQVVYNVVYNNETISINFELIIVPNTYYSGGIGFIYEYFIGDLEIN